MTLSPGCEEVSIARMAIHDGEESLIAPNEVTAHLDTCAHCQREMIQLDTMGELLKGQTRREESVDLWPAISERLAVTPAGSFTQKWPVLVGLGLMLLIFKLIEMIPERDFGFLFKLVPLLLVVILFAFVKENPFKISLELKMEGDR